MTMHPLSLEILQSWKTRKSAADKAAFRARVAGELAQTGYPVRTESGGLIASHNLILGDPDTADLIVSAHYDTCAAMPLPNLITPRNPLFFLLYQLLLAGVLVFLAFLPACLVSLIPVVGPILALLTWSTTLILLCFQCMAGKANPSNLNDNTSGVITLLEAAFRLPPQYRDQVAFVLFDNEELGLLGSSLFRHRHPTAARRALLINLDCVSEGDYFMLSCTKALRQNLPLYNALQTAFNPACVPEKTTRFFPAATTLYPSDQWGFPKSMAIAALKKAPVLGLYLDRIHTWRDTRWDSRNVEFLADALVRMAASLPSPDSPSPSSAGNLILCGFMGCGKSTVGRLLAQDTGRQFLDMDAYIEQQAGMSIPEIFRLYGETDFRRREREACAALSQQSNLVIATGGGALADRENARLLASSGTIILLEVSAETVLSRLEGDTSRPLLARPDRETAVRELMAKRMPLYREAAHITVSGDPVPTVVVQSILNQL